MSNTQSMPEEENGKSKMEGKSERKEDRQSKDKENREEKKRHNETVWSARSRDGESSQRDTQRHEDTAK